MKPVPYRREELVKEIHHQLAVEHEHLANNGPNPQWPGLVQSIKGTIEKLEAIAAVLEDYPMKSLAEPMVDTMMSDLRNRKGFAEVLASPGEAKTLRDFWVSLIARTVIYTPRKFETPAPAGGAYPPSENDIDKEAQRAYHASRQTQSTELD